MAIKLKVLDTKVNFKIKDEGIVHFGAQEGIPIYPADYTGAYIVTPTEETQTLPTEGLMATHNVVVNPIPQNYGRITWNGSIITVS